MTWLAIIEYLCHKWPRILCSICPNTSRSFPHYWPIAGFVTRATQRVPLVEQVLHIFQREMNSFVVLYGGHVSRSQVVCAVFVDGRFSFCPFSFGHCVVSVHQFTDSDYPFGIFKLSIISYILIIMLTYEVVIIYTKTFCVGIETTWTFIVNIEIWLSIVFNNKRKLRGWQVRFILIFWAIPRNVIVK